MGRGGWILLAIWLCLAPAGAKDRQIQLVIPLPQGRFPPPWTDSIRISVLDEEELIQDHRHYKKGDKEFRAILSGHFRNKDYQLELLCLGKQGKPMGVFHHKIKLTPTTKKLELKQLKFIQVIKD